MEPTASFKKRVIHSKIKTSLLDGFFFDNFFREKLALLKKWQNWSVAQPVITFVYYGRLHVKWLLLEWDMFMHFNVVQNDCDTDECTQYSLNHVTIATSSCETSTKYKSKSKKSNNKKKHTHTDVICTVDKVKRCDCTNCHAGKFMTYAFNTIKLSHRFFFSLSLCLFL